MVLSLVMTLRAYWGTMEASAEAATASTTATITLMEASSAIVFAPSGTDAVYVVGSLCASHITVLYRWVAIIGRLG